MTKLTMLMLACLTLAASIVPVASASADVHKDNFRKSCTGNKAC